MTANHIHVTDVIFSKMIRDGLYILFLNELLDYLIYSQVSFLKLLALHLNFRCYFLEH